MTGSMRKGGFWNRSGSVHRQSGRPGGTSADYQDALTVEEAVEAAHRIKLRSQREDHETHALTRETKTRSRITLSSPEWLANFMKED